MTMQEFDARVTSFYQIKHDMVPEIPESWWQTFKDNPLGFFRIAKDSEREAIWRASDQILLKKKM